MKQTIQLGALSAANIGLAFIFQWYVVTQLGAGPATDALFAGMTLPQLVLTVISGSLMHVLVPLLSGSEAATLRHDAWAFLILIGGLFTVLAVALYLTAQWWVPMTVPGFSESGKALTIDLTRIQLAAMVFAGINGVQWAAYHARQEFIWAEFTPLLSSIVALVLLVWTLPRYGVMAVAWITTLRVGLQTLLLAPAMGMPAWPDLKNPAITTAWRRIKPLLLGTTYYKTDTLVDSFFLSAATSGSLSLYYLAQQIYGAASQVLNKSISAPLVPRLSQFHRSGRIAQVRQAYYQKLFEVGFLSLLGLLTLGVFGEHILELLVGRGNVTAANVVELWSIMIWLGGMFFGGVMGQITSSTFYACGDTVTPTKMSIVTYTLYVPAKSAAFLLWGVQGLAITTSAYLMINFALQLYLLEKKYG